MLHLASPYRKTDGTGLTVVLAQYAGAFIYILIAAVLQYGYDPNIFSQACTGGAIICIVVYGLIKMVRALDIGNAAKYETESLILR